MAFWLAMFLFVVNLWNTYNLFFPVLLFDCAGGGHGGGGGGGGGADSGDEPYGQVNQPSGSGG